MSAEWDDVVEEGYDAYLEGLTACPYTDAQFLKAEAWRFGWRSARDAMIKAMGSHEEA